jgi:hypothetical protein
MDGKAPRESDSIGHCTFAFSTVPTLYEVPIEIRSIALALKVVAINGGVTV